MDGLLTFFTTNLWLLFLFYFPDFCGGTYRGIRGRIRFPEANSGYDAGLNCTWIIEGPASHFLKLNVNLRLSYQRNSSGACIQDNLDIIDLADSKLFSKQQLSASFMI